MINDLNLSAVDLDDNMLGGTRLVEDYLRKTQIIRELQVIVDGLTFEIVGGVVGDITLSGKNQHIVCRNVAPITVTLSLSPVKGAIVDIKRRDDVVNIIGTVDGIVDPILNVPLYSMRILYDGVEYVQI